MRKKRIARIYNKIIQIAQKGKDAYIDYYNYVDDIVNNGEYVLLQDVFSIYFSIDIKLYQTITLIKEKTFALVRFNTSTSFEYRLQSYYDAKNVYQVGKTIYDNSTNEILGQFTEVDRPHQIHYLGVTYSYYPETIYYRNTDLFKILDEISVVELQVSFNSGDKFLLSDPTMLLLDKYKIGVDLLISNDPSLNQYFQDDYIDDYYE